MSLMRRPRYGIWDPFRELEDVSSRLNRLFGTQSLGSTQESMQLSDWTPSVNISETPEAYKIDADLPGVKKEDIKLECENGVLQISGERSQKTESKDEKVHRVESSYGSFMRRFTLPDDAAPEGIEANMKEGELHVVVPRMKKKVAEAKQIPVK